MLAQLALRPYGFFLCEKLPVSEPSPPSGKFHYFFFEPYPKKQKLLNYPQSSPLLVEFFFKQAGAELGQAQLKLKLEHGLTSLRI